MLVFFDSWTAISRIAVTSPIMYIMIVCFVRLAGKRSTSQMNNFDWVVTVALGSMVGSVILLKDVVIADALFAIGVLLGLQYIVTLVSVRFPIFGSLVRATPALLFFRGRFLREAMLRERVCEQEIMSAIRESGQRDPEQVEAVVLESDAKLSVISREKDKKVDSLSDVYGYPPESVSP